VSGAVRSSELRDEGIKIADVSPAAQTALCGELRVAEDDNAELEGLPACSDLNECQNYLALELASGAGSRMVSNPTDPTPPGSGPGQNSLIQAKLERSIAASDRGASHCGLVNTALTGPRAVLDEAGLLGGDAGSLSAVVKGAGNPTIALRCATPPGGSTIPTFTRITALEVGTVTGP
jgi:hypothetical protein